MRLAARLCVLVLLSTACQRGEASATPGEGAGGEGAGGEGAGEGDAGGDLHAQDDEQDAGAEGEVAGSAHAIVGSELPQELVAELRLEGDDADGRLLTLAPSFVATAACSDCGAPSYLRILAVRCVDTMNCEVLSETCEGSISRESERYELEFHAVEGAPEGSADVCAAYSGSFVMP